MFQKGDKAIIVAMMGSTKKWADLRPLIEKGFELEGTPIAKLPPAEERTLFRQAPRKKGRGPEGETGPGQGGDGRINGPDRCGQRGLPWPGDGTRLDCPPAQRACGRRSRSTGG